MRTRKATPAEIKKYNDFVDPLMNKLIELAKASNSQGWSDEQNALAWKISCFEKQSGLYKDRTGVRKVTG